MSALPTIHRSLIHRASLYNAKPTCMRPRINFPTASKQQHPTFSTGASSGLPSQKPNADHGTNPKSTEPVNPEFPKISLEGLGISKNVRIVLYVLLSIWGSFETYFYYQAVMRWWRAGKAPESEPVD
ncbi:hypothetical protein BJY01DRAFT_246675 [Aspergillus pseudoustus]|uniref:Uncharacterized protein n=1 Tax=Aspergillus pseudoustus TaxID=1810923 RepID=A0ABR4K6C8_9EURO